MLSKSKDADPFKELRWSDIQDWAGGKATAKGIKYQEEERVKEIKLTPEGSLVAWVIGTIDYFTEISLENGKLTSICTCPVEHDCKHGVAAVLEYLERLEQGEEIPVASEEDTLTVKARKGYAGIKTPGTYEAEKLSLQNLREYLEQLEKSELIEILVAFAEKNNMLGRYLRDRQSLASENTTEVIEGIYSELGELWKETRDYNSWNYENENLPDFSDVEVRLESLLDAGHPEELLEIGKELMDRYEEIAEYDEEGEIGTKVSSCMDMVFKALSQSSLPAHEKMLYALEIELKDNYNILDEHSLWNEDFSQDEWKIFAETLKVRLQKAEKEQNALYYASRERNYVIDRLIDALGKAGLSDEIIPICELEAEESGSYVRLVRVMLDSGEKEKAEKWIYRGIRETREGEPGTAHQLWQILLETKEKEENWLFVTTLEAEEFFRYPQLGSYIGMQEAARKVGKWQEIREAVIRYLKTGELEINQVSSTEESSILPGILPKTGLLEINSLTKIKPPVFDLLIKIAIQENNPDEVVYWYDKIKENIVEAEGYRISAFENEIANAVKDKYPEIAIEIWEKLAERLISETKVSSYEAASVYLRKIKETLEAIGKKKEWESYLSNTRESNRRKRKLLEILDTLGEDRIIRK